MNIKVVAEFRLQLSKQNTPSFLIGEGEGAVLRSLEFPVRESRCEFPPLRKSILDIHSSIHHVVFICQKAKNNSALLIIVKVT